MSQLPSGVCGWPSRLRGQSHSLAHRLIRFAGAIACVIMGCLSSSTFAQERPRVIVLTDFFKDPDDKQSMIRFLTAANEFEVEGLIATSLAYGDGAVHPEWIRDLINEYAAVLPSLRRHEREGFPYPSAESLARVVRAGAPVFRKYVGRNKGFAVPYPPGSRDTRACDPAENWIGAGKDTAGSEHIINIVDKDDPRGVWIVIWGGAMDLAQALWKVRDQRTPDELSHFISRLRVHQISWQDTGAVWIWNNFPNLFLIQNTTALRGIYAEGPPDIRSEAWVNAHIREGHGPLGAQYPQANIPGIKEGDTPSFLSLLSPGLSDPEHPEWGGWGGRFRKWDPARNTYVEARDRHPQSHDPIREAQWTVGRWNVAANNDFAARLDWCVREFDQANHHPIVLLDQDDTRNVLHREIHPGQVMSLDAAGTNDPDGDTLSYLWWQYHEAGTYDREVGLRHTDANRVELTAPAVQDHREIHLILEVTDDGRPPLTSYRRVIVAFRPEDDTTRRRTP